MYFGKPIAPAKPRLLKGLGLRHEKKFLSLSVVDFLQLIYPLVVLFLFEHIASDLHLGDLFDFAVFALLTDFEHPDGAEFLVLNHGWLLAFSFLVTHLVFLV